MPVLAAPRNQKGDQVVVDRRVLLRLRDDRADRDEDVGLRRTVRPHFLSVVGHRVTQVLERRLMIRLRVEQRLGEMIRDGRRAYASTGMFVGHGTTPVVMGVARSATERRGSTLRAGEVTQPVLSPAPTRSRARALP